ncbi:hypothetical protein MKX03_029107 [Papaver bracteatum]|nr:hypothetical protein MKX03_029107 [Papaver bracteatum]
MDSYNKSAKQGTKPQGEDDAYRRPNTQGNNQEKRVRKRPSAIRDFPLNFQSAGKVKVNTSRPDAATNVGKNPSRFIDISDDEDGSVNAPLENPGSSAEYTPATPPSKSPAQQCLPFEDDAFQPNLYKPTGSVVAIGDSAIQDYAVARGIMFSIMLPMDRHFYDGMTKIPQVLDRDEQLHYVGLSLIRRAGELHYEALDEKERAHKVILHRLQRENDQLKREVKVLQAKSREAGNALSLMCKQRVRASFEEVERGGYAYVPSPDERTTIDDVPYDPEEE